MRRDRLVTMLELVLPKNSSELGRWTIINSERGSVKYIGKDAGVVLNELGRIVTTWARNSAGFRILPKESC
jgi:hypothetical protein